MQKIEKKRSEDRAEHVRTVRKILDFAEGGTAKEREKALELALGIEMSRSKEREEMRQEKETAEEFKDSQLLGTARMEKSKIEQETLPFSVLLYIDYLVACAP